MGYNLIKLENLNSRSEEKNINEPDQQPYKKCKLPILTNGQILKGHRKFLEEMLDKL